MFPFLILKPQREKSLLQQHPWIFSGAIAQLPEDAQDGDIVSVLNSKQHFMGFGFYTPDKSIAVRMIYFGKSEVKITGDFWEQKIKNAFEMRKKLHFEKNNTNCYRLLHAEGDFLSGIIIDVYDNVVVVQLLHKGIENIFPHIQIALENLGFKYIYLKNTSQNSDKVTSKWLTTPPTEDLIIVKENGISFPISVEKGQKTGFFIDQRESRLLLKNYAKDKSILNTFAYTGGFSAYAFVGGAQKVVSVDISQEANLLCEKTIELNAGKEAHHEIVTEDCFDYLKNSKDTYDIVIIDPPAFAKGQNALKQATRGYISLNELALKRVKKGGLLFTFSCSGVVSKEDFRKMVFSASMESHREVRILHQLTQPADHPINIFHPEGEYLKGLVLEVF
jgi:23S rRNA (cytosine1962-C5)-methyltransferase